RQMDSDRLLHVDRKTDRLNDDIEACRGKGRWPAAIVERQGASVRPQPVGVEPPCFGNGAIRMAVALQCRCRKSFGQNASKRIPCGKKAQCAERLLMALPFHRRIVHDLQEPGSLTRDRDAERTLRTEAAQNECCGRKRGYRPN